MATSKTLESMFSVNVANIVLRAPNLLTILGIKPKKITAKIDAAVYTKPTVFLPITFVSKLELTYVVNARLKENKNEAVYIFFNIN